MEDFAGIDGGEDGEEIRRFFVRREVELAGGEVEPAGGKDPFAVIDCEEEAILVFSKLATFKAGARGDDAGEGAFDEFARLRGLDLVDNSNLAALFEDFRDVVVRRVVGDASHGHVVAFSQGDPEEAGAALSVLFEHFIKVP